VAERPEKPATPRGGDRSLQDGIAGCPGVALANRRMAAEIRKQAIARAAKPPGLEGGHGRALGKKEGKAHAGKRTGPMDAVGRFDWPGHGWGLLR
jgi:hypothetical protein